MRLIAEDILKNEQNLDPEVKEIMLNDLIESLNSFINKELVLSLSENQVKEFNQLLETNPSDDQTIQFFLNNKIDVNKAVQVAVNKLREAYQG